MKADKKESTSSSEIKYNLKDLLNTGITDTIIKEEEKRVFRPELFSRAPIRTKKRK